MHVFRRSVDQFRAVIPFKINNEQFIDDVQLILTEMLKTSLKTPYVVALSTNVFFKIEQCPSMCNLLMMCSSHKLKPL